MAHVTPTASAIRRLINADRHTKRGPYARSLYMVHPDGTITHAFPIDRPLKDDYRG